MEEFAMRSKQIPGAGRKGVRRSMVSSTTRGNDSALALGGGRGSADVYGNSDLTELALDVDGTNGSGKSRTLSGSSSNVSSTGHRHSAVQRIHPRTPAEWSVLAV